MMINTNKTTLFLVIFLSPSWQHLLKVSKSGEIGWVTQMQLLATLSAYPHYSLFCHAGPGGHRPLKSSSSTRTLNDCNTQSFILYHKTANSPIYSFSKHVSHTELNLASQHRIWRKTTRIRKLWRLCHDRNFPLQKGFCNIDVGNIINKYAKALKLTAVPFLYSKRSVLIPEICTSHSHMYKKGQMVFFGQMIPSEINIAVTIQKYNKITLLKQNYSDNSWTSVFIPEIAVLAYFTADSTTLPLETEILLLGHQRHGCLLAFAALL